MRLPFIMSTTNVVGFAVARSTLYRVGFSKDAVFVVTLKCSCAEEASMRGKKLRGLSAVNASMLILTHYVSKNYLA